MFVIFVHYFLSKFCLCIAHFTPWEHSSLTSARAETKIAHVRCSKSIHVQNLEVIEEFLEFLLIIKGIYLSFVRDIREPPEIDKQETSFFMFSFILCFYYSLPL